MAAYLNPALTNFRATVNRRWPGRDKTSDGWIGDERHQKTDSDHNPDQDGSVDAWDMDVDGVDVWACIRAFEAHESSGYWIYNDQIAHRVEGWRRRSYAYAGPGRNRHDKHVHFNTRSSHERSAKPWNLGEDDDMSWTEKVTSSAGTSKPAGVLLGDAADRTYQIRHSDLPAISRQLAQVLANQEAMAGKDWVDEQEIVEGVLAGLGGRPLPEVAQALRAAMGPDRTAELGRLLTAASGQG